MITLQPMSPDAFAAWQAHIWPSYRDEMVRAGMSEEAADENVQQNIANTMPDGVLVDGNYVFAVMRDNEQVGSVWLTDRFSEWFIYDIEIREELRGQGLGRSTMRAIEEYVRAHGGKSIGLSVFGFNNVARKLYESEGYETTRILMKKDL